MMFVPGDTTQRRLCTRRSHQNWRRVCFKVIFNKRVRGSSTLLFRVMIRLVEAICEEVNR